MKAFWLGLVLLISLPAAAADAPAGVQSRAWVVIDTVSGRELAGRQADLPLAPASLTQLMTAYVLLGDLKKNKLSLAETVTVPEIATQADGARIFLKAGDPASVDTLIQAMLVHSATDAVLTLVQAVDGSEAKFVARMNAEAKRLGMVRTRFMNATGLTEPGHESSARDLAILSRALIRDFPDRLGWFAQKEVAYNGLTHYNANRLLWRDSTVDGLKVGRTVQAGYCMAASARRGAQGRIAIVLGARSDAQRTQDALKLLNFAFENFDSALLYRAGKAVKTIEVYRGARASVNLGFQQDFHLLAPRGALSRIQAQVITQQPVVAPIRRGQRLGTLRLTLDGEALGDYPLVALHEVAVAGIFGRGWDSIRLMFQ
ncbi:MAG: D-alanyl-D-alanine carboxypeptidase [Hydrogenophilales bacterium 16-64-46]|nr:MAG: D-alanyl-D-alanine carboxypeptidase [Hydrogenophilales bacterium 12-64-13]OYZ05873.1 MAG: D-alanyl-D-alanine carboxypeptidase [Hydrogenophilales bacterium 16-64-46]OZA39809.1 MAG: D-alanyl-D-alanine carboxypeptidase [Hydrogenophilales bacterium 17-64-34]HQT00227.1 D-alanyl-D-alanine carboxypeptidase family protein [Thiobacillus sp.]